MSKKECLNCWAETQQDYCDDCESKKWWCDTCDTYHFEWESFTIDDTLTTCQHWLDNHDYFECAECNELFSWDEYTININWNKICQSCLDDEYYLCDNCNEWEHKDNTYADDNNTYCERCFNEYYIRCQDCEYIILSEDAYNLNWTLYCQSCYDENHRWDVEFEEAYDTTWEILTTSKILINQKQSLYEHPYEIKELIKYFYETIEDIDINDFETYKSFDIHKEFKIEIDYDNIIDEYITRILRDYARNSKNEKYKSYTFIEYKKWIVKLLDTRNNKIRDYKVTSLWNELEQIMAKEWLSIYPQNFWSKVWDMLSWIKTNIILTNDLIHKKNIMYSANRQFGTCQTPDNVFGLSQWFFDIFTNWCNLVLWIYNKDYTYVQWRMIVRFFIDSKWKQFLFFDRLYTDGTLWNLKDDIIIKLYNELNWIKINNKKCEVVFSKYSAHESSWTYRLDDKYIFDTENLETLRQPARLLKFHKCAYYRDSWTYSYQINSPGSEFHGWIYDTVKYNRYAKLVWPKVKENRSNIFVNKQTQYITLEDGTEIENPFFVPNPQEQLNNIQEAIDNQNIWELNVQSWNETIWNMINESSNIIIPSDVHLWEWYHIQDWYNIITVWTNIVHTTPTLNNNLEQND